MTQPTQPIAFRISDWRLPMAYFRFCMLHFAFLILHFTPVHAADPVVTNVQVAQRRDGSKLADIYYDLSDADTDTLKVWVEVSADGGEPWTELTHVTGDVGENVLTGTSKHIVWDIAAEFGTGSGTGYVAKVVAEDTPPIPLDMVLIPAGTFQMGDPFNEGSSNELPVHTVYLDAFFMDRYEVTNAQYCVFLNDQGNQTEGGVTWLDIGSSYCLITQSGGQFVPKTGYENHPVIEVTWYGARAYCEWAGGRLPTEAEWEYAARGGLEGKRYPWGDAISHDDANYSGTGGRDQWSSTSPVGSFPPNGYGLHDMAGNVWEWCNDWYDSGYYSKSPSSNPTGPSSGSYRVLRGGSWYYSPHLYPYTLRCASRYNSFPAGSGNSFGFRCVRP